MCKWVLTFGKLYILLFFIILIRLMCLNSKEELIMMKKRVPIAMKRIKYPPQEPIFVERVL